MTGIPGRDIFASASGLLCSLDLSRYLGEIATKDRRERETNSFQFIGVSNSKRKKKEEE